MDLLILKIVGFCLAVSFLVIFIHCLEELSSRLPNKKEESWADFVKSIPIDVPDPLEQEFIQMERSLKFAEAYEL